MNWGLVSLTVDPPDPSRQGQGTQQVSGWSQTQVHCGGPRECGGLSHWAVFEPAALTISPTFPFPPCLMAAGLCAFAMGFQTRSGPGDGLAHFLTTDASTSYIQFMKSTG